MEESGVFEYWFAFLFALGFCVWFPTYVVKTKGQGISTWGLALCIVFLFIGLPLLSISLIRDVLPSLWLSFTSANYESPSISLLYGTIHKMATLDQLYVALAMICILVAIGQSIFASWLLYIRHNRESLVRALRIMWSSAFFIVLAAGILPLIILGSHGFTVAIPAGYTMGAYIAVLMVITAYLRMSPQVADNYPISHQRRKIGKRNRSERMEFLMAVRTLIATTVMLFCSLWLARQLKIHRPRLPVSAVLILSLIMLFEPGMLAFLVWVVHDIASVNGGLMIHAYTFVKASVAIYLLFILPSIWFARSFYVESKLVTLKALRFAIILPVAFTAVVFIEVPKMIWQDRATELVSSGLETFIVVAVINLILLGLTYRFKPSNTPAP